MQLTDNVSETDLSRLCVSTYVQVFLKYLVNLICNTQFIHVRLRHISFLIKHLSKDSYLCKNSILPYNLGSCTLLFYSTCTKFMVYFFLGLYSLLLRLLGEPLPEFYSWLSLVLQYSTSSINGTTFANQGSIHSCLIQLHQMRYRE